jgi:hypothetical protein
MKFHQPKDILIIECKLESSSLMDIWKILYGSLVSCARGEGHHKRRFFIFYLTLFGHLIC